MRVFWSLMLGLFVVSLGVVVRPGGASHATADLEPTAGSENAASASRSPGTPSAPIVERETPAEVSTSETATDSVEVVDAAELEPNAEPALDVATENDTALDAAAGSVAEAAPSVEAADPFAAAAEAYLKRTREDASAPQVAATGEPAPSDAAPSADETPAPVTPTETAGVGSTPAALPAYEVRADGSLRVGETVVPGDGSASKPFVIEWSLLTGVAREYKPEQGKNKLPGWLSELEGKRVRLTGHVVLPLVATSTDELLLTMNPWDGCCVGVPPTPYDAMEVTTREPISMHGSSLYGSVEGTFRTDPYIVSGWLLGLYLLDDASVVN